MTPQNPNSRSGPTWVRSPATPTISIDREGAEAMVVTRQEALLVREEAAKELKRGTPPENILGDRVGPASAHIQWDPNPTLLCDTPTKGKGDHPTWNTPDDLSRLLASCPGHAYVIRARPGNDWIEALRSATGPMTPILLGTTWSVVGPTWLPDRSPCPGCWRDRILGDPRTRQTESPEPVDLEQIASLRLLWEAPEPIAPPQQPMWFDHRNGTLVREPLDARSSCRCQPDAPDRSLPENDEASWVHSAHRDSSLGWGGPPRRPPPERFHPDGEATIERAPSHRIFAGPPSTQHLAQMVHAAYRVGHDGRRPIPSAGSIYGLDIHALPLGEGPHLSTDGSGRLIQRSSRSPDVGCTLFCQFEGSASLLMVTGNPQRYTPRYGRRAFRYMLIEAGHCVQVMIHTAQTLGYVSCPVGAFDDEGILSVLNLTRDETLPLYGLAVGMSVPIEPREIEPS